MLESLSLSSVFSVLLIDWKIVIIPISYASGSFLPSPHAQTCVCTFFHLSGIAVWVHEISRSMWYLGYAMSKMTNCHGCLIIVITVRVQGHPTINSWISIYRWHYLQHRYISAGRCTSCPHIIHARFYCCRKWYQEHRWGAQHRYNFGGHGKAARLIMVPEW